MTSFHVTAIYGNLRTLNAYSVVTVNPDILVETVGANVSILITVRNVEVNAIVMKTPVTFKLDVQMSPKVRRVVTVILLTATK